MAMPVVAEAPVATTLTEQIFGFSWAEETPWRVGAVTVRAVAFAAALPFMEAHYPAIFARDDASYAWLRDPMTPAKRRFCERLDAFQLCVDDRTVGLLLGQPWDWSSYYIRSVAVLPDFQGRGAMGGTVAALGEALRRRGVERAEVDVSAANRRSSGMFERNGFVPMGMANSERWGALVRYAKFLSDEAEDTFLRQFCGPQFTRRPRVAAVQERRTS